MEQLHSPAIIASPLYHKASGKAAALSVVINVIVYFALYIRKSWSGMNASGFYTILGFVLVVVLSQIFKTDITDEYLYESGFYSKKEYEKTQETEIAM